MNNLSILTNQSTIKSTELVEVINEFRKAEGNDTELQHKSFMEKIRKELEVLEKLNLDGQQNILPSSYINSQNKKQPCFELNRDGMLQMLNSESTYVRYKTIEYINKLEEKLKIPTTYKEALLQLVQAEEEKEQLQLENKQKDQIIGELKPRADYTDLILTNKGLVTITQIAKDYGMSGQELNKILHELGVQYKQSDQWLLYVKYHGKGYTHSETIPITRSSGREDVKMNTKWTQKGRLFLYNLLKENGILPMIEREVA